MKRRNFLLQTGASFVGTALFSAAENGTRAQAGSTKAVPAAGAQGRSARPILHPGILQTKSDLARMKAKVLAGDQPWKSAWDKWLAEPASSLNFRPQPFAHIVRGAFGAGQKGGGELMASAAAAASHANQWVVTGNEVHARKVVEIFDAWSALLADFSENDAMLVAGWTGGEFANAAEILRATYSGWSSESMKNFKRMLLAIYVPLLRMYYPEANGNWDAAIMFTLLAIGVFCEDRQLMESVYAHYRLGPVNSGITRYVYPSGQCEETTRDQNHAQLGLGYFAQTALVAWNQGTDLFGEADNRLALAYEYTARLLLGEPVPVYGVIVDKSPRFHDGYELILEHYQRTKQIRMPYTEQAAPRVRSTAPGTVCYFRGPAETPPDELLPAPAASTFAIDAGAQTQSSDTQDHSAALVPGTSIQEALDRAAAGGSGTVRLAAGVHMLPATLRIPSNITLEGTGRDCILFLDTSGSSESACTNQSADAHDIVLRNFIVEGAETAKTPADPNSGVMHRRSIRSPIRFGILMQAERPGGIRNLRCEHLTVRNCTASAVEIYGADGVEVDACDFSGSGGMTPPGPGKNHNLKLHHASAVRIDGSRMADSLYGSGISLSFVRDVRVSDCELTRNQMNGITVAESSQVTIEKCLLEGNSGRGVDLELWMDANKTVVVRNLIERNNGSPA
jgi:parallel beta-helix repeat protein